MVAKKRSVDFILKRKLKFYTKEIFKFFNLIIIAIAIIAGIIMVKYKPIYEVKLSGEEIGYVENKQKFESTIVAQIQNYQSKNVCDVTIAEEPEYALKLVSRNQETNEDEIIINMQKDMIMTYQYFEIHMNQEKIDAVDTLAQAEEIATELKQQDSTLDIQIVERETQNETELQTNTLEGAKANAYQKLNRVQEEKKKEEKMTVNGIKLAVLPVEGTITSRYGVSSRIRSSDHTGLDIGVAKGTPIKAVASGTVTAAQYTGAYGNLVKIDHGNGVETWYAHTNTMKVTVGQTVQAGDIIATVGTTGNSTGPHLHLEIRINGVHVDPQRYMYS